MNIKQYRRLGKLLANVRKLKEQTENLANELSGADALKLGEAFELLAPVEDEVQMVLDRHSGLGLNG